MLKEKILRCEGCGVEFTWSPVIKRPTKDELRHGARQGIIYPYCCQDCLDGSGCDCSAKMELDVEYPEISYSMY